MNAIKDSIKSGRTVVGTTVTPNVDVSILADAGYDFLLYPALRLGDQAAATVDPDDARQAGGAAGARRREPGLSDLLRAGRRGTRHRCADGQHQRGGGGRRARLP